MSSSIDSCQNRVSADQYHMTIPRAQVSTHRGQVFFEVMRWQITSFKWSQAQVYFFQWFIWNMFMSSWPSTIKILISNWPWTQKFSQFFKNTGGEDLFLPRSCSMSNFYALIGQNLTVSSCGKFMQHLESCLLWQVKLTEFCVNLWCF